MIEIVEANTDDEDDRIFINVRWKENCFMWQAEVTFPDSSISIHYDRKVDNIITWLAKKFETDEDDILRLLWMGPYDEEFCDSEEGDE